MRFTASRAGIRWQEAERLAEACEAAELTRPQAEAVRYAAEQLTYREIADAMGVPYRTARSLTRKAESKLKHAHPGLVALQRRALRDLQSCIRNVRDTRPAPIYVYRAIAGGHENTPVTLRPRPMGEVPEDLLHEPLRFLRELPQLLDEAAHQSAVRG